MGTKEKQRAKVRKVRTHMKKKRDSMKELQRKIERGGKSFKKPEVTDEAREQDHGD